MNWRDWDSAVAGVIVDKPRLVVLAFAVVTLVFLFGVPAVSTEAGTEQFTQDLPEFDAIERVEQEFGGPFDVSTGSTQLIQTGENVVSKPALLRMLRIQEAVESNPEFRVTSTRSSASMVAQALDPGAETAEEQVDAVEDASVSEVRRTVRSLSDDPAFTRSLSTDFNPETPEASTAIGVVSHDIEIGVTAGPEGGGGAMAPIQTQMVYTVETFGGDVRVFGNGIFQREFSRVTGDSLKVVVPAAVFLIVFFLVAAYRDPLDLALAVVGLLMAIVWTLGFMGFADIPFTEMLVALPPILLAVGIDFSIHAVNRYREERVGGLGIEDAMERSASQLIVAFAIVAGTSSIGFAANLSASLPPIRQFGTIAAVSIVFVVLIFGVFMPAAKVLLDRWRLRNDVREFASTPLGMEGGRLANVLTLGTRVTKKAPVVFVVLFLLLSAGSAYYATGVDTTFSEEGFLPPEEKPIYIEALPAFLEPGDYTAVENVNLLAEEFEAGSGEEVLMYLSGDADADYALQSIQRAGVDPPSTFLSSDREAESSSVNSVIQSYAGRDEEFASLVRRNDPDGDGVPEDDVEDVLDALFASSAADSAGSYVSTDRRSALVTYSVDGDAEDAEIVDDAWDVADRHRLEATPTGQIVLFQAVTDLILRDAVKSLAIALFLIALFMVGLYWLFVGRPLLGLVNMFPVVVAVSVLAGTMRFLDIPFNAITATILSITIGLGIDYTVHTTHRFVDEYDEGGDVYDALITTMGGTGGALTGSMLTTSAGTGVLVLAIIPIIGQFGVLTATSIFYSFLASVVVLPPAIMVWAKYAERAPGESPEAAASTPS